MPRTLSTPKYHASRADMVIRRNRSLIGNAFRDSIVTFAARFM